MSRTISAAIVVCLLGSSWGCSAPAPPPQAKPTNPTRTHIELAIKTLKPDASLPVRYNPAACDCPPFELRLSSGWIRAGWTNINAQENRALRVQLKATQPAQWPVNLLLKGSVDNEVMRTSQGQYAVRITSTAVVNEAPKPQPGAAPPPAQAAPAEPAKDGPKPGAPG